MLFNDINPQLMYIEHPSKQDRSVEKSANQELRIVVLQNVFQRCVPTMLLLYGVTID